MQSPSPVPWFARDTVRAQERAKAFLLYTQSPGSWVAARLQLLTGAELHTWTPYCRRLPYFLLSSHACRRFHQRPRHQIHACVLQKPNSAMAGRHSTGARAPQGPPSACCVLRSPCTRALRPDWSARRQPPAAGEEDAGSTYGRRGRAGERPGRRSARGRSHPAAALWATHVRRADAGASAGGPRPGRACGASNSRRPRQCGRVRRAEQHSARPPALAGASGATTAATCARRPQPRR